MRIGNRYVGLHGRKCNSRSRKLGNCERSLRNSGVFHYSLIGTSLLRHSLPHSRRMEQSSAGNSIRPYVAVWKLLNQNLGHCYFVEPLTFDRSQSASASSDFTALYKLFDLLTYLHSYKSQLLLMNECISLRDKQCRTLISVARAQCNYFFVRSKAR